MNGNVILAAIVKDITGDFINAYLEKDIDYHKLYTTFSGLLREMSENRSGNGQADELADEKKKIEMLGQLKELFDDGAITEKEYKIMKETVMVPDRELEKTVICEFCGFKYPEKYGVCPKCNGIRGEKNGAETCPKCGNPKKPGKNICTKCGFNFKNPRF